MIEPVGPLMAVSPVGPPTPGRYVTPGGKAGDGAGGSGPPEGVQDAFGCVFAHHSWLLFSCKIVPLV
jgi:hypothetical protein